MAGSMKACGIKIIWMDMEHTNGVMEGSIKDSTKMIRSTDLAFTPGSMEDSMKDIGIEESNMVLDCIIILKTEVRKQGCGRMASALSGLLMMKSIKSMRVNSTTVISFRSLIVMSRSCPKLNSKGHNNLNK